VVQQPVAENQVESAEAFAQPVGLYVRYMRLDRRIERLEAGDVLAAPVRGSNAAPQLHKILGQVSNSASDIQYGGSRQRQTKRRQMRHAGLIDGPSLGRVEDGMASASLGKHLRHFPNRIRVALRRAHDRFFKPRQVSNR
jgi:hypothetical protein